MALIGRLGTAFLGAIVGVAAQGWWTRRRERDQQRERQCAAARLVRAELQLAAIAVSAAIESDAIAPLETVSMLAWRTHGIVLATLPSSDDFDVISSACLKLDSSAEYGRMMRELHKNPLMSVPRLSVAIEGKPIRDLLVLCERAIVVLHPLAYP